MNRALATKDDEAVEDIYDAEEEQARLRVVIQVRYRRMLEAVHEAVTDALDLDPDEFRLDDEAVRALLDEAAERVVRIDETTRDAIREQLRVGQSRGYSSWEIANGVAKDDYRGIEGLFKETWKSRPETVARTELAHAQLTGALNRYEASGVVDRVQLIDGDQDAACAARNGQTVPLASRPGLAHPNCTLTVVPIVRGTE